MCKRLLPGNCFLGSPARKHCFPVICLPISGEQCFRNNIVSLFVGALRVLIQERVGSHARRVVGNSLDFRSTGEIGHLNPFTPNNALNQNSK